MSKASYHHIFKVVFVTSVFCLVSVVVLIGLSTLASKYSKSHASIDKSHSDSSTKLKAVPAPTQNLNSDLSPSKSLNNSKSNH